MVQIDHAVRLLISLAAMRTPSLVTIRPGTPTTTEFGGTSFNTTEPAPILELEPTVKDPSTLAPLETTTLSPIVG